MSVFDGPDPVTVAERWLEEASATEPNDPNAMQLATVDADGLPDVRTVLLKEIEKPQKGTAGAFLFYTNYESAKSRQIEAAGGRCAFVLHWKSLRRQVRVRGVATREDGAKADGYYASRGLDSRLGAWASRQSRPLERRETLMEAVEEVRARFGDEPPRPPHWGGWRIRPEQVELWADGAHRLHDRFLYDWTGEGWTSQRLNP